MMKTAAPFAAWVVFAIALYGQSKPPDVVGWDKIAWGMTIAEARSVYSVDTQPEADDDWTLLKLRAVKMGGVEMGVQVGARHGTDRITLVRLWSYFGLPTSAPSAGPQDFETLKTQLIEKYGQPAKEEVKRGENFRLLKSVLWSFPSTSILMTLEQSSSIPNIGNIYLDYTATDR
ncbi:MAG TPA: hypothetical protein VK708_22150 [Bryobacteraceae bacterium]|jgi:hypothetical protein|nr:hypothetical protein [Bryobacteraceae bacterium]